MSKKEKTLEFPEKFLWGTATAAHQVEGNNTNSDWWQWEQKNAGKILDVKEKKFRGQKFEPTNMASDHYHHFAEDFDLLKEMKNNAHRLSIEWARIEPQEGEWDLNELEHYRQVLQALKDRKIKIMLTLNHFTLPNWLAIKGGWLHLKSAQYFKNYVSFVAKNLGPLVDFWITINEPEIYMDMCYLSGYWPPQKKDVKQAAWAYFNMARAHKLAYRALHKILDTKSKKIEVGIAMNVMSFAAYRKHNFWELFFVHAADRIVNHSFYDLTKKSHDFLGVNYYFRVRLRKEDNKMTPVVDEVREEESELCDMGWVVYPHGIFDVLMDFKDFNLPIYITENGIATENEEQRSKFIINHLAEIHHAIQAGVDVRGYFYWSLLDNFEWDKSFGPKFGLVAVNRKNFIRTPKASFETYKKICEKNSVTV